MSGRERQRDDRPDGRPGMASAVLGRRELIGSVALVAGGIAASAVMPWPQPGRAAAALAPKPDPLADWTIDDMWGVYPRYAEPIGYGRAQSETVAAADSAAGSIEALFYA